jgi:hypothetical protein
MKIISGDSQGMIHSIKTHLYKTIHRNKKSAAQLADETGISYSYLCRAGLPMDESGVRFPVDYLVPLMKSANDYSVLKHIAALCGFLCIRTPRGFADKRDEMDAVNHYNALCAEAGKRLMDFFRAPSQANLEAVDTALQEVMQYAASLQRRIKNHNQMELEL